MKLQCNCGFDTESFSNIKEVRADLKRKGESEKLECWYEDDFENRCPHCGKNGLRLIED